MSFINKKLKYQIIVFLITYAQLATNNGYKATIASCKAYQELERPLQLDNVFFGQSDFFFILGLTVGALVLGHMADHMDLRLYLLIYSISQAILFALLAFTADIWFLNNVMKNNITYFHFWLFFLFFLNGMIFAMCLPSCSSIISRWIDIKYRGKVITIWCSSINMGSIVFFQICFQLLTIKKYNWRGSYYFVSIVLVILGIISYLFLDPYPEELDIVIADANNDMEYTNQQNIVLESHVTIIQNNRQLSIFHQLLLFFNIKIVRIALITYSLQFMVVTVFEFWLNKYLKNEGFFHSAHKIQQLYELSCLIGGVVVGSLTDKQCRDFKFSVFSVFQIISGICLIYLQFNNNKQNYFLLMFIAGFFYGGIFNYFTGVGGKILEEDVNVKQTGIQLTTIFAVMETTGSFFTIIMFIFIPILIDQLLLVMGICLILSAFVCVPEIFEEIKRYKKFKKVQKGFHDLLDKPEENSKLIADDQSILLDDKLNILQELN